MPPSARAATETVTALPQAEPYQTPLLDRMQAALRVRFRLPTEDDAPPANARLFAMSFWAASCVFVGLIPAGRLVVALLFGGAPGWYPFIAISIGMLGTAAVAAAFAAIHRAFLPWYLLGIATLLLAANVALIYTVL